MSGEGKQVCLGVVKLLRDVLDREADVVQYRFHATPLTQSVIVIKTAIDIVASSVLDIN